MVLESLVVDLLNRFLGDYVVNLDRSQLRLGIWGGDVVLENLEIKESALSDLDVPFLVKVGFIGRLTLKIPWKNLYNDSVMASLEDLHLLIVPTTSVKYDAQKEKQQAWDAKQRELQRIDQALQKTMAPGQAAASRDSFAEKLATQVVKNLQINVSGIHLRYEDDVTYPTRALALGFTLGSLSFQTAGQDWKPCLVNVTENVFNKLVNLDCLAAYCNVNGPMFCHKSPQDVLMFLRHGVASKNQIPSNYHYIFRPVSGTARLAMSPRTDLDLSRPKVKLDLTIQEVAVELMKTQYLSAMELLESIDRAARNAPYRKYRPEGSLHGNCHLWWQYAITSVRKEMVGRKLKMWSWSCIRRHREKLKQYKDLYMQKLSSKKPSEELLSQLRTLEEDLDVLNIVLGRRHAESQ
uniref:intermembrane lipid transfer protein VPS13A-like n=1 Tax=Myxine glutinosa TaxID=7769 RepID=UPI00358F5520